MNILENIADHAKIRVRIAQEKLPLKLMRSLSYAKPASNFSFKKTLQKEELSFICECKKASPSKGIIAQDFPYLQIAKAFEDAGADCISVLTEPKCFQGADQYLQEIASTVKLPCLRKDFVVDEYMLYEARLLGASGVLLICSLLTDGQLKDYLAICNELKLDALVEVHTEKETEKALNAGAEIIGINNRDLKSFTVNLDTTARLREMIPNNIIVVSESGISSADDIAILKKIGVNGVLVGEALMMARDKGLKLQELRG